MIKRKCITIALAAVLLAPPLAAAQTRETDPLPARVELGQGVQAGGESQELEVPVTKDALSTAMTGAPSVIGAGDLLSISVFDTPELARRVRVNSQGTITLPLIGELHVRGMTANALENTIRQKLMGGDFVKDPQVSVFVLEYAGQMAYVTGEVFRPGAYPLMRSHRLLDLIAVAGGLTPRAGSTAVISRGEHPPQILRIALNGSDPTVNNPEILPGDSISVAQAGIVYVLGDVGRPGGFLLDHRNSLSVVQAVALAEGTKPSAALSKAVLIRTSQGNRQKTPLNLKLILKSQSPDPMLVAGDIIYVPGSLTRGLGRTSIEVLESSAGLAAVYATRP